jgi:phosphate transport system permease protein
VTVQSPVAPSGPPLRSDVPRVTKPGREPGDLVFRSVARTIGWSVLVITGAIGAFLGYQSIPTLRHYGWSFFVLQPHAIDISRWLSQHLGFLPVFHVDTDPNAAVWQQSRYTSSAFIAGLAVAMMAIPLACAVMRAVFDQAPLGEREAAMALGATRWGVVKNVVIPFGKGGIIGGTMLALGRALGETIVVLIIISPAYDIKFRILEAGTQTTSALIAGNFGEATRGQLSALLTAGFVLFLLTIMVNTVAAVFIGRSRSGAATDI